MQTAFVRFTSNDPIQSDVQVRKNADAASKKKGANPIVYDATMNAGFGANARSNRVAASIHRHFKPNRHKNRATGYDTHGTESFVLLIQKILGPDKRKERRVLGGRPISTGRSERTCVVGQTVGRKLVCASHIA